MKNPVVLAVLNFVACIAFFAFLDLAFAHFDFAAFVKDFTRPMHLAIGGGIAFVTSIGTFFQARKKIGA